jgi:hypothetical protein
LVRLKLGEVIDFSTFSIVHSSSWKFNESASKYAGIGPVTGFLVLTDSKLVFFESSFEHFLSLPHTDLRCVRPTIVHHHDGGVCVEETAHRGYLFAFDTVSHRDQFLTVAESLGISVEPDLNKEVLAREKRRWIEGELSSFDYLIRLNLMSGRTWADLAEFPFLPWVLNDYDSPKPSQSDSLNFRNLSFPIFAQTEDAQTKCDLYFRETSEMPGGGQHLPVYVSNIGSPLLYLVRVEPFTSHEMDFQGGRLDAPSRTFTSLGTTFGMMKARTTTSAVELVPELYYLPELCTNLNGLKWADTVLPDLSLPPWAKSPAHLVYKMRQALESQQVSGHLHE